MGNFQMEVFMKAFDNLEDMPDLQDIPEQHREEFKVFMRLMKARTLREIRDISFETILGFLGKVAVFASYLNQNVLSMDELERGFHAAPSVSSRRVL